MILSRRVFGVGLAAVLLCAVGQVRAQLSPEAALKALKFPAEFDVSLFASEPMITNPAAIDVDTRGRVWVAEIQWYRRAAKNPPADKIKVLEDTNGDGKADKVTVFADGVFSPMSICVAGDKVYVATSPDLWVYEDKNGDLKADGPPKKLLTGFGGYNHDHAAHSLVLGPDHKWWMAHGDGGFDVAGPDGSQIKYQWGGILRGELDGTKLETVAVNFRNPYEVCVSSFGEPFCSDNDNDGNFSVRICWIMEGGNYGWFGRPPGPRGCVPASIPFSEHWHFRGHIPGFVPATLVTGFGSPCGMCFYEGDAFGPKYKNAPWHTDNGPRELRIYRHEKAGAGMKAASQVLVTSEGDNYFRPDDICAAPDGSLYMSDWYDGGVGGHAYNNPDQGRVFLLRPKDKKLARVGQPGPYASIEDAIEGLKNPNLATQFLAREKLIAEGARSVPALKALLNDTEPNNRARALWVLDRIGGEGRQAVVGELKNQDAAWRALAVRILRRHGAEQAEAVLAMADDADVEVRREVLLALSKLSGAAADAALVKLASTYDGRDRYLLEAINIAAEGRRPQLYAALEKAGKVSSQNLALLQLLNPQAASGLLSVGLASAKNDADRLGLLDLAATSPAPEIGKMVAKLAADTSASTEARGRALEVLGANLSGAWQSLKGDAELTAALRALLADKAWQPQVLGLVAAQGLKDLGPDALALARDAGAPANVREKALAAAVDVRAKGAAQMLETLLAAGNSPLRRAALAALVELQDWSAVKRLLNQSNLDAKTAVDATDLLMQSTGGALVLMRWIDEKAVPEAVQKRAISRAATHADANVRVLYEKFIPADQRPKRLGEAIDAKAILALQGNPQRGEQIYQSTAAQCKNCHVIKGFGKPLGPDLTQIGKKYERATLLETILDPSKAIAPEFIPYVLVTSEGMVHAGFVVEQNDREVVLKDANSKLIRVRRKNVESLEPQKKSMMPELVLRDVTAQDAADLLAFLTTLTEPLKNP